MSNVCFSCDIVSSDPSIPLSLTILRDSAVILELNPVPASYKFEHSFEDSDVVEEHTLEFVLENKLPEHTQIDEQGNIVQDVTVTISNKTFESVLIDTVFNQKTQYHHNFNGTGDAIDDEFHSVMGCNGRARFTFTTPIYLWMLENL